MATIQPWHHDALALDLSRHLMKDGKAWVWLDSTIGAWSGPRPDVMSYRRFSYDHPTIAAYEAKVSRADLLADLNKEKWRAYLEHCQSVTFVMPSGLATKDEIPAECGVMFRTARGWRTERRPTHVGSACSLQAMAKLLTMHPLATKPTGMSDYRQRDLRDDATRRFLAAVGKGLSAKHAGFIRALARGEDPAAEAEQRAAEIIMRATKLRDDFRGLLRPMLDMLGLNHKADEWAIKSAIRERVRDLQADSRVAAVEQALGHARASLARVTPLEKLDGFADPATDLTI